MRGAFAIAWLLAAAALSSAADFAWIDTDWSAGRYIESSGIDPDIWPGQLVLSARPEQMLFLDEPTDFRGIYGLTVYHDTLFIAAGPYPLTSDGADILTYHYESDTFGLATQLDEQGVMVMKVIGDTLLVPGPDSQDPWTYGGSVFLYNGHEWFKRQGVLFAAHVFDADVLDGVLYTTDGDGHGWGNVSVSYDWGESYTQILSIGYSPDHPVRRFYGMGCYQGLIYIQPDGFPPEDDMLFTFDGAVWDTIPVPGMPEDRQGKFTAWGDSLIFSMRSRMFILAEETVSRIDMPFSGDRWCHSVHKHGPVLFGGAEDGLLYRWEPGGAWTFVTEMGLDPQTEEISALATYRGRLYIGTARDETLTGGRLYVSACETSGSLISQVHDFGHPTMNASVAWEAFVPGESIVRVQIRSAPVLEELELRAFTGPDGTAASFYENPGAALEPWHRADRYFQYRIFLIGAGGILAPYLASVSLTADSLDYAGFEVPDRAESGLTLAPVRPSPVTRTACFELRAGSGLPVHLQITDAEGRLVREMQGTAPARWHWDLRNTAGRRVPVGRYWAQASQGATQVRRSFIVLH